MTQRTRRLALAVTLAAGSAALAPQAASALPAGAAPTGMICTPGTVDGSTRTFNLVANTGYISTPDGNSILMWSYANADAPDDGHFQSPGPVLCSRQGETVVVNLTNTLPEPTSIVFPGQDAAVAATGGTDGLLTTEAPTGGGTVSYRFTAGSPGTYRYESGTDVAKQVEMGLYGALVVRPSAGDDLAYDSPATRFNPGREYLLLLSEIDPDLHHAVETGGSYDINALHNRYFAINGREFPDTIQDNGSALLPNQPYGALVRLQPNSPTNPQPALLRMINVGLLNHPFHPHGNHTRQIAQDGRLVAPTEHFGETVAAGQTQDYLLRWDDTDNWDPVNNPLPVGPPNYRDVVFKDGDTYYSGSPYLGGGGTLPTGTVSQNVCGEWYFPMHSHALNEFSNFDEGFGGMATMLRVDPPGGCVGFPTAAVLAGGTLRGGSVAALGLDDSTYLQVGAAAVAHPAGTAVTALATDWYATFAGLPAGAQHVKVSYRGRNCAGTTGTGCASLAGNEPAQTVKICDWTVAGAAGCASPTAAGWVPLPAPPDQPRAVGSTDVTSTWTLPDAAPYVGTGANSGQLRVLVHTQRSTAPDPAPFATWGNLMKIVYDAP